MTTMHGVTRMQNSIVLYYTPHEVPPTDVPPDLRNYYSKEVWGSRLPAVVRKSSRYYKRKLEWAWLLTMIASMIALPIALFYVSLDLLPESQVEKNDNDRHRDPFYHDGFDRYWKARLISLGTWFALVILFYTPMLLWKRHGKEQVNKMLQKWEKEDKASSRTSGSDIPSWRVKGFGILSSNVKIMIRVPAMPYPTSFHPAAYLPSYLVNGPADPAAAHFYQQNGPATAPYFSQQAPNQFSAMPRSATGIPLYNVHDEQAPGYNGSVGHVSLDEKMEDIKV